MISIAFSDLASESAKSSTYPLLMPKVGGLVTIIIKMKLEGGFRCRL